MRVADVTEDGAVDIVTLFKDSSLNIVARVYSAFSSNKFTGDDPFGDTADVGDTAISAVEMDLVDADNSGELDDLGYSDNLARIAAKLDELTRT